MLKEMQKTVYNSDMFEKAGPQQKWIIENLLGNAIAELDGYPYKQFVEQSKEWRLNDCYSFPGPIQFTGPAANIINQTLAYEIQERKMKN